MSNTGYSIFEKPEKIRESLCHGWRLVGIIVALVLLTITLIGSGFLICYYGIKPDVGLSIIFGLNIAGGVWLLTITVTGLLCFCFCGRKPDATEPRQSA